MSDDVERRAELRAALEAAMTVQPVRLSLGMLAKQVPPLLGDEAAKEIAAALDAIEDWRGPVVLEAVCSVTPSAEGLAAVKQFLALLPPAFPDVREPVDRYAKPPVADGQRYVAELAAQPGDLGEMLQLLDAVARAAGFVPAGDDAASEAAAARWATVGQRAEAGDRDGQAEGAAFISRFRAPTANSADPRQRRGMQRAGVDPPSPDEIAMSGRVSEELRRGAQLRADPVRYEAVLRAEELSAWLLSAARKLKDFNAPVAEVDGLTQDVNRTWYRWQGREETRGPDVHAAMMLAESIEEAVEAFSIDGVLMEVGSAAVIYAIATFRNKCPDRGQRLAPDTSEPPADVCEYVRLAITSWRDRGRRKVNDVGTEAGAGASPKWDPIVALMGKLDYATTTRRLANEWSKHRREVAADGEE